MGKQSREKPAREQVKAVPFLEDRYAIVDIETGEVLDDAQGYGYKTAQKAYAAFFYTGHKKKAKASARKGHGKSGTPFSDGSTAAAFVDGSYDAGTGFYSFGMVFFYNGKEERAGRAFPPDDISSMRNVAGELAGAIAAIKSAADRQAKRLTIYHDYTGIAAWADGSWQANKSGTIRYRDFVSRMRKQMRISFVKVAGHSGNYYNELADELAREAIRKAK